MFCLWFEFHGYLPFPYAGLEICSIEAKFQCDLGGTSYFDFVICDDSSESAYTHF